jgi:Xaa-Pro aminopeptidase
MDFLKPGVLLDEQQKAVTEEVEKELVQLGLFTMDQLKNQKPESPLYKQYFMHGVSHHLGLDTHDFCDRYAPMAPGMVLTVEPGIYLPKEGFGIRLENDILITETGFSDLTGTIPLEVEEIEELVNNF